MRLFLRAWARMEVGDRGAFVTLRALMCFLGVRVENFFLDGAILIASYRGNRDWMRKREQGGKRQAQVYPELCTPWRRVNH